jgi:hypothetical protein
VHNRKPHFLIVVSLIVLLSAVIEGCVIGVDTYVFEEPFTEKQLNNIHNGETSKKDVLRWFGPPLEVTRPRRESVGITADGLFKPFESSPVRPQIPLLYYYRSKVNSEVNVGAAGIGMREGIPVSFSETVIQIWILIDEKTGMVLDHRIEKTVNGTLQQETAMKSSSGHR